MDIQRLSGTAGMQELTGAVTPKPGSGMGTHMPLKELKSELRALTESELDATSVVEVRGTGPQKEFVKLIVVMDDARLPRCPHVKLPMNNRSLSTMVEKLSSHYGKEADNKELSFLTGGFNPPGYCQVTLEGTGLGLYFEKATGQPMGKLTGTL